MVDEKDLGPRDELHYVSGNLSILNSTERNNWKILCDELEALQGARKILEIPYNDPYWTKKAELDRFAAKLRR